MPFREPSWTVGIEEEYLLVDRETRDVIKDAPPDLMTALNDIAQDLVRPEFLTSQVEVGTQVSQTIGEARADLARLRKVVAEVAGRYGLAPIAASTHPFGQWQGQKHTNKDRYNNLARDMQAVARRLLICGMHVHVGIESEELRIDLMNQASYFLPHLLALSTSSPFWRGEVTGLKSYRLSVFDEVPRTGLPEQFESYAEFKRHVDVLVRAGLIEDASMMWWDIRPSAKFPTLEMRITDVCTNIDDAASIAGIYVCILRMLYRLRRNNQRWRKYARMLIDENRWRAQRYGLDEGLVDFGKGAVIPCTNLLDELLDMIADDADALGCTEEIFNARDIARRGTSAHRQIATYEKSIAEEKSPEEALRDVVDML
ncbi:MAG: carboxylate-amine ligase, partial [Rhodospirillales bacterium]|nr:carboxylate-amine ligase [Rhodospirillales bacterium]